MSERSYLTSVLDNGNVLYGCVITLNLRIKFGQKELKKLYDEYKKNIYAMCNNLNASNFNEVRNLYKKIIHIKPKIRRTLDAIKFKTNLKININKSSPYINIKPSKMVGCNCENCIKILIKYELENHDPIIRKKCDYLKPHLLLNILPLFETAYLIKYEIKEKKKEEKIEEEFKKFDIIVNDIMNKILCNDGNHLISTFELINNNKIWISLNFIYKELSKLILDDSYDCSSNLYLVLTHHYQQNLITNISTRITEIINYHKNMDNIVIDDIFEVD
jgi:hypothetical protein